MGQSQEGDMQTPTTRAKSTVIWAIGWVCLVAVGAHADVESAPLGPVPESLPIGTAGSGSGADPFAFGAYLQTVVALAFVLGLAVLASALVKRFARSRGGLAGGLGAGGPSPSGVLEILGRYPLGSGQTLILLRFDRRVVLLHQSGGRKNPVMRTISEVVDSEEVASIMMKTRAPADEAVNKGFRETIRKLENEYEPFRENGPSNDSGWSADRPEPASIRQQQIDMLVGDDATEDVDAIRGMLRGWVGASS